MMVHTGFVEKVLAQSKKLFQGEADYTVTCSSKFVPYEFPANEFSK